ncbi:hypothetical protein BYT27DRAFT_7247231 [Phlegmacium glaucopus]|nr:hypothetical protein BYT27DRAFT_7247231 [Phlegmacium glaucopus]
MYLPSPVSHSSPFPPHSSLVTPFYITCHFFPLFFLSPELHKKIQNKDNEPDNN